MRNLSTIIILIFFALIPIGIWTERAYPSFWQDRLFSPNIAASTPNPGHFLNQGKILPSLIEQNLIINAKSGPYRINQHVEISPNGTLTIEPGAKLYFDQFTSLTVHGQLFAQGTAVQPVNFITNEVGPDQQTWNGIIIAEGGQANLTHISIEDASPGISCLLESNVAISHAQIQKGALGIFTETQACTITNSRIRNVTDGIAYVGVNPSTSNTAINAKRNNIVEKSTPVVDPRY